MRDLGTGLERLVGLVGGFVGFAGPAGLTGLAGLAGSVGYCRVIGVISKVMHLSIVEDLVLVDSDLAVESGFSEGNHERMQTWTESRLAKPHKTIGEVTRKWRPEQQNRVYRVIIMTGINKRNYDNGCN
jgi:hypothetical protein